jgi:hypothetical protein
MNIHHYTSVETLACILETKKLRLNNLNDVNDLEEGQTKDFGRIGQHFFVSCWTLEPEESIPLWQLYAGLNGVRLTLPHTFAGKPNPKAFQKKININDSYFLMDLWDDKIKYTEDEALIYPKVLNNGEIFNGFSKIGRYKRKAWKFEKEWRIMRLGIKIMDDYNRTKEQQQLLQIDKEGYILGIYKDNPYKFHDIKIFEDQFKKMEILLGPIIGYGNEIIVKDLIEKYNPSATIERSHLKIK